MNADPLMLCPLMTLLLVAAIEDLRSRRIRNWLTVSLALSGIVQSFLGGTVAPVDSILGLLTGFGLTFLLFGLNALGGGDVKLLSAVGAWLGPWPTVEVFMAAAVIGLVVVVSQAIAQRRMRVLLRNSAVVTMNLVHMNELGVDHVSETGQDCRSVDRPLPYAVPVLIAVALVVGGWWRIS